MTLTLSTPTLRRSVNITTTSSSSSSSSSSNPFVCVYGVIIAGQAGAGLGGQEEPGGYVCGLVEVAAGQPQWLPLIAIP